MFPAADRVPGQASPVGTWRGSLITAAEQGMGVMTAGTARYQTHSGPGLCQMECGSGSGPSCSSSLCSPWAPGVQAGGRGNCAGTGAPREWTESPPPFSVTVGCLRCFWKLPGPQGSQEV